MKLLTLDPSITAMGYAIFGGPSELLEAGLIKPESAKAPAEQRDAALRLENVEVPLGGRERDAELLVHIAPRRRVGLILARAGVVERGAGLGVAAEETLDLELDGHPRWRELTGEALLEALPGLEAEIRAFSSQDGAEVVTAAPASSSQEHVSPRRTRSRSRKQ
jgi:hypothetical protein